MEVYADAALREIAERLDATGWAVELYDPQWRVVAFSSEWRLLVGDVPEDELGYGRHAVEARILRWTAAATPLERRLAWLRQNLPRMASATPGGMEALMRMLTPDLRDGLRRLRPEPWQSVWTGISEYGSGTPGSGRLQYVTSALGRPDGVLGWSTVYGPYAPATVTSLLMRGRLEHFARMASLRRPERHEAAVVFADIESSASLARHMTTGAWFELIRAFTTAVDDVVIDSGGIVGRHAGDGVSAFFLADQLGSRREACAAAVRAGTLMTAWRPPDEAAVGPGWPVVNVGVHWGGALYLGQVVSGGRLEVTALGDEVNECARIQESARGGSVLVSKPVVERLSADQARGFGIDPLHTIYTCVSELSGVSEKAIRDAGSVPVIAIP